MDIHNENEEASCLVCKQYHFNCDKIKEPVVKNVETEMLKNQLRSKKNRTSGKINLIKEIILGWYIVCLSNFKEFSMNVSLIIFFQWYYKKVSYHRIWIILKSCVIISKYFL